jgi:hypothetical protein
MATNRHFIRRHLRRELTHAEEMELWLGPSHRGSLFASREDLQEVWLANRDRVMAAHAKWGRRPMAWWEFEAPFPRPSDRERSALFEAGLLGVEEREQLVAWWRRQFERAYEPLFFHCEGPGRYFSGAVGRRKHYRWADIPRSLLKEWAAQRRRRRSKAIRQLVETAAAEQPVPAA